MKAQPAHTRTLHCYNTPWMFGESSTEIGNSTACAISLRNQEHVQPSISFTACAINMCNQQHVQPSISFTAISLTRATRRAVLKHSAGGTWLHTHRKPILFFFAQSLAALSDEHSPMRARASSCSHHLLPITQHYPH